MDTSNTNSNDTPQNPTAASDPGAVAPQNIPLPQAEAQQTTPISAPAPLPPPPTFPWMSPQNVQSVGQPSVATDTEEQGSGPEAVSSQQAPSVQQEAIPTWRPSLDELAVDPPVHPQSPTDSDKQEETAHDLPSQSQTTGEVFPWMNPPQTEPLIVQKPESTVPVGFSPRRESESPSEDVQSASVDTMPPPPPPPPASNPPLPPVEEEEGPSMLARIMRFVIIGLVAVVLVGVASFAALFIPRLFGTASNEPVTIEYWGLWEDSAVWQEVLSDFNREYSNITVNYTQQDPKQYSERLLTRIQNGSGPDLFRFHNSWYPQLTPVLAPLTRDVISADTFSTTYYPVMTNDLSENGALFGIPIGIDTLVLYTNNTLFQQAGANIPVTWTEFINVARALTVKDENNRIRTSGAALGTFDNVTHAPDIISLLFLQNGVDMNSINSTTENAADALTFYTSFVKDSGNVWDATREPSRSAFARGTLAMYFGYSWDAFIIRAQNPQLAFTVSPVPRLPDREISIASYWAVGASQKSEHQKEVMQFLSFLTRRETLEKLYASQAKVREFGEAYPRIDMSSLLTGQNILGPVIVQSPKAQSSYFVGETQDTGLNAQMNGYLGNAIRAILGNTSAESAINTLSQGVSQVLDRYATQQTR
jgi:multiple sugar transport system substrate-binding protein